MILYLSSEELLVRLRSMLESDLSADFFEAFHLNFLQMIILH